MQTNETPLLTPGTEPGQPIPVASVTKVKNAFLDEEDEFPTSKTESAPSDAKEEGTDTDTVDTSNDELEHSGDYADLDELASLEDEIEEDAVVMVYKKKCLKCKALVPWAEKTYTQCHFSNGNENCPAQSMQIKIRIPMEDIVPRFLAAEEQNDTARLVSLFSNLGEKEQWVQDAVHAALRKARAERALK